MRFDKSLFSAWTRSYRWGAGLFSLSLVGAALAVGAVHTPVLAAVALGFVASAALLWWDAEPSWPRRSATVLFWVAVALTVFTLLQALPLPAHVVAALDPRTAEVWAHALDPLREHGPVAHSLSLDPVATKAEALRGVVYLAAFLGSLRLAARREGVEVLCVVLVGAALLMAIVALLHPAFGAQRVFGVYKPETVTDARHVSPLLNPNPLAAYLNVGICVSLAAALSPRPLVPRPVSAAACVVLIATSLWVASRGGVAAMVVGGAVVIALTRARADATRRFSGATVLGILSAAGVAMMVLAASKDAWEELSGTDTSKLAMQGQMLPLVSAHKWLGVGRGAFESAYPAVRTSTGHMLFTHPEHVIVQWASEWGLPVSLLALGLVAFALRPSVVAARTHLVIGPWAALATGLVHNLVDLNSEVPAVMLMFVVCAGAVVSGTSADTAHRFGEGWAQHPRRLVALVGIFAVFVLSWTVPTFGFDLHSDRQRLHDLALETTPRDEAFVAAARGAMLRHPAEPYLPFCGALSAARDGSLDAIPWAARTVENAPVYGPVHMLLGRTLRSVSPSQARLEYRLAMEQAPELLGYVLREATATISSYDDALELVPLRRREAALAGLAPTIEKRLPSTRALIDDELLRVDRSEPDARVREATERILELEHPEPWCEENRDECLKAAKSVIDPMIERAPTRCEPQALLARAVAAAGDANGAAEGLSAKIATLDEPAPCLTALVRITMAAGLDARLKDAVNRLARAPCPSPAECAANLVTAGEAEAYAGRLDRALLFFRRAHDRLPESDAVLERVASTTARLGLHAEAAEVYERLARRHPELDRFRAAADAERAALGGRGMGLHR